jgi:hypothetical protein
MRKSLDLVGDGDELDLVLDIEHTFGVKFTDAELEACGTAGDLNQALWQHMEKRAGEGNIRCINAMAFNALRRALKVAGASRNVRPSDRLENFGVKPKQLSLWVHEQAGLALGFAYGALGEAATILVLAGFACIILGIWWHGLFIAAVALFLCAWGLIRQDSGSYKGCETVGDAVAKMVRDNFGKFVERGARFDAQSVWHALRETLSSFDGCPADEIGPDTLLICPRKRWFATGS